MKGLAQVSRPLGLGEVGLGPEGCKARTTLPDSSKATILRVLEFPRAIKFQKEFGGPSWSG